MKKKNVIKESFDKINASDKLESRVLASTIETKGRGTSVWRPAYISIMLIVIFISSITVVYAEDIKDVLSNWYLSVMLDNGEKVTVSEGHGFKHISDSAPKTDEAMIEMSYYEVERALGFKILKLHWEVSPTIHYSTGQNENGQIGRVDLWLPNFYSLSKDKTISVLATILNEGADKGYISSMDGRDAFGNKTIKKTYTSKKLDTSVVIYSVSGEANLTAELVYDDIVYDFITNNLTLKELENIIESLSL